MNSEDHSPEKDVRLQQQLAVGWTRKGIDKCNYVYKNNWKKFSSEGKFPLHWSSSKLSPAHWPLTTNMISTFRQSRNLSKNILFKILHALECIFIHIIKSRINILCYWKKKPEKNGRMTLEMSGTKLVVSRLLLDSILCLMIPLQNILLFSPMHDAPLFSPNQKHHCYLKTVLYKIFENWCLENW